MAANKQDLHLGAPKIGSPTMGVNVNACPQCGAKGYIERDGERITCTACKGTEDKRNAATNN